jgi:phthiodiolone/phenolphthiodiolone dimycocerosates ketoreductase
MTVQTQVVYPALGRDLSVEMVQMGARAYAASNVVDACLVPDFVVDSIPPHSQLSMPGADVMGMKGSSFGDPFLIAGLIAAGSENLGVSVSTDSIRRNPTELIQTMLSLANITHGNANIQVGAGEAIRMKRFGYKRSDGLGRLEDLMRLFQLYWEHDEPFDFEGNYVKMAQASLGAEKTYRPRFWCLGGGPKLMDIATSFADGIATAVPGVFPRAEQFAEQVVRMRKELERRGRDPDNFDFAVWLVTFIHEDEDYIAHVFEQQPLVRWVAAAAGRFYQADWQKEGHEPPFAPPRFPKDFMYARHYSPHEITEMDIQDVLGRFTPDMARKSYVSGAPHEVANVAQSFIEAGATHVVLYDCMPMASPTLQEAQESTNRVLEVCRQLKTAG